MGATKQAQLEEMDREQRGENPDTVYEMPVTIHRVAKDGSLEPVPVESDGMLAGPGDVHQLVYNPAAVDPIGVYRAIQVDDRGYVILPDETIDLIADRVLRALKDGCINPDGDKAG